MTAKKKTKKPAGARRKKPDPGLGGKTGKCPACGKPVGDRSKTCLSCGAVLDPASIRQA
ncbi:MAG: zinc-ribbon domain-containing protein [Candidatus Aminicenantales bacterium]